MTRDDLISAAEEAEHEAVAAAFAARHVVSRARPGKVPDLFEPPVKFLFAELRKKSGAREFAGLFPVEVKIVQTARWRTDVRIAITHGTVSEPPALPDHVLSFQTLCEPALQLHLSCFERSIGPDDFDRLLPLDCGVQIVLLSAGRAVMARTMRTMITGRVPVVLH